MGASCAYSRSACPWVARQSPYMPDCNAALRGGCAVSHQATAEPLRATQTTASGLAGPVYSWAESFPGRDIPSTRSPSSSCLRRSAERSLSAGPPSMWLLQRVSHPDLSIDRGHESFESLLAPTLHQRCVRPWMSPRPTSPLRAPAEADAFNLHRSP